MASFLRVMQPISLEVREEDRAAYYPSLVLDYTEEREIAVGVPMHKGYEVLVRPGTLVSVQIALPDGLRSFTAEVLRRTEKPSPALHLTWPRTIERIQRRNHVRVEIMIPAQIATENPEAGPRTLSGNTVDVSAGGVRLALMEVLDPESEVELTLHLPNAGERQATGRVIRSGEIANARGKARFWVAIEFREISEATRKDITKFVFDTQRDQFRKGVI